MKKTIKLDLLKEGQTLYFDILRLAELEAKMNKSILEMVREDQTRIDFTLNALAIGLKHNYDEPEKVNAVFIGEEIDKFLDKGGSFSSFIVPISQAIYESGIFGRPKKETKNVKEETAI